MPVRFPTARSLFETFPEAAVKAAEAPIDAPSLDFLQNLAAKEKFEDALTFCAYLLPRREAVWWACRCARALLADGVKSGNELGFGQQRCGFVVAHNSNSIPS